MPTNHDNHGHYTYKHHDSHGLAHKHKGSHEYDEYEAAMESNREVELSSAPELTSVVEDLESEVRQLEAETRRLEQQELEATSMRTSALSLHLPNDRQKEDEDESRTLRPAVSSTVNPFGAALPILRVTGEGPEQEGWRRYVFDNTGYPQPKFFMFVAGVVLTSILAGIVIDSAVNKDKGTTNECKKCAGGETQEADGGGVPGYVPPENGGMSLLACIYACIHT